jgi:N-formylglutamate deformylase
MTDWLTIDRGKAPLVVSIPHAGTDVPDDVADALQNLTLARQDADHHVDHLYGFAADMDATIVHTAISRTVIDVNRDPSGQSLYPGQTTTGLCPTHCFDGTLLYKPGREPDDAETERRRHRYFVPYHAALSSEISRLRKLHPAVVVYDAHSILSNVPRLFDGELAQFNIGSFDGKSCSPDLTTALARACNSDAHVINGRFKGGWITRHYGDPISGIHAIQMELAMRGYLDEKGDWPPAWDASRAAPLQSTLRKILAACLTFAKDIQ